MTFTRRDLLIDAETSVEVMLTNGDADEAAKQRHRIDHIRLEGDLDRPARPMRPIGELMQIPIVDPVAAAEVRALIDEGDDAIDRFFAVAGPFITPDDGARIKALRGSLRSAEEATRSPEERAEKAAVYAKAKAIILANGRGLKRLDDQRALDELTTRILRAEREGNALDLARLVDRQNEIMEGMDE